ncbi:MAG: hypothetical protein EXS38_01180 [Opitutus sp.]|nr:hypothetical protein [Opitutus sp.]
MFSPSPTSFWNRRQLPWLWTTIAALPVVYIATVAISGSRNIVYYDEFETALDLLLRMDAGAGGRELLQRFFALSNEHRTVTSRLIFAAGYWLTGGINFHVISAIGNLFLVGAAAILIGTAGTTERRLRLGVLLGFGLFQLENFEGFIWAGASIDHFQVIALAIAAIAALARGTPLAWALAAACGLAATFTLAHGAVVWPVGALLLWQQRRWARFGAWGAVTVAALALFLYGFEFNPGHRISSLSLSHAAHVVRYWLALLGGPLTLGAARFAPWLGVLLLGGLAYVFRRGAAKRETIPFFTALYAIGALALVAFGRSEIAGPQITSRYLVIGNLAWALWLYMLVEARADPLRPSRELIWLLPALVAFNLAANLKFAPTVQDFNEMRDRAATSFMQYGKDGRGLLGLRLHPQPLHADRLLKAAAERGIYALPRVSQPAELPAAPASTRMVSALDELVANDLAVTIGGWAMLPGERSRRGAVFVVLDGEKSRFVFSTLTLPRADIAKYYQEPKWKFCGFRAVLLRDQLPAEDFTVGIIIIHRGQPEVVMTTNRLLLAPGKPAAVQLATKP